jgi:RNA polymerase sigma-70 factor, ECF subfamily
MNGVVLAGSTGAGESLLAMNGEGDALAGRLGGRLMVSRSERKLIRAAQGGSEAAMEELFRLHWPRAQRAAFLVVHDRAAAEDIAQEGFLSALRALERFDRRRPFGPWLHRIVVNRAIDHARSRKLRREVEPEPELADERPPATDSGGLSDELIAALRTLSPEHRAVVVLRYLLEFTPGEIAEALEMPRGTVNSRLRRGLDRLSLTLEEEG